MAVVELKNISKIYSHNLKSVNNVSMTSNDKEFVCLRKYCVSIKAKKIQ